jgi:hypothetical protein
MPLFIVILGAERRLVRAPHEADAATQAIELFDHFPDAIDVAPFYTGPL